MKGGQALDDLAGGVRKGILRRPAVSLEMVIELCSSIGVFGGAARTVVHDAIGVVVKSRGADR